MVLCLKELFLVCFPAIDADPLMAEVHKVSPEDPTCAENRPC